MNGTTNDTTNGTTSGATTNGKPGTSPGGPIGSPVAGAVAMAALVVIAVAVLAQARDGLGPDRGTDPGAATTADDPIAVVAEPIADSDLQVLPDDSLLGFVEVPGGSFLMGSDPGVDSLAYDIERWSSAVPVGTVDLPTFFIARTEVTSEQFRTFAEATGRQVDSMLIGVPGDHPAAFVSWPDAVAYASWLDGALREWPATPVRIRALLDDGWTVSIPTEAQWEKAARGTDGRLFPWGNELRDDLAHFAAGGTVRVGSVPCPECAYGLADMAGNVWEWTRSPYQPYPYDAADDRETVAEDALFVMRGGSFADGLQNVRATVRGGADPGARRPFIGFRVAVSRN